jgi:phage shock protein B
MMTVVSVACAFFAAVILGLAIVIGMILAAMRLRRGGFSEKDRLRQGEETRMIQEIYNGLGRMESRIEALETIIMEDYGKEKQ